MTGDTPIHLEWLLNWAMVFLRASGLLLVFPVFSAPSVPVRLRVALSAMLAFFIAPTAPVEGEISNLSSLILTMAMEVAVGLIFGFASKMLFYALDLAGALISAEIGLSLPPSMNPLTSGQSTLPGSVLNFTAIVVWLTLDMHHWLLAAFQRSFALLPSGAAGLSEPVASEFLRFTGGVFVVGLQIAAPVLAVSFVVSLVLSVLGRAVTQMNIFTESFAIRLFSGLAVFGMSMDLAAQHIMNHLGRLPEDMLRLATLLGLGSP
jgi:flagellar biosynthetic protein FliR